MKVSKISAVLYLYHRLSELQPCPRKELETSLGISIPTFHRYIAEIRNYLADFEGEKTLVYSRKDDAYYLK
jgi:transcriptional antiterminator